MRLLRACVAALLAAQPAYADFKYVDFNATTGLTFNGDSTTSSCGDSGDYGYDVRHGLNDAVNTGTPPVYTETAGSIVEAQLATFVPADVAATRKFTGIFPTRDNAEQLAGPPDPAGCPVRLRLTPARPYKRSSTYRQEGVPALNGWDTAFSFQITDFSSIIQIRHVVNVEAE